MKQDSFAADSKLIEALRGRSQPVSCSEDHILFKQGDPSVGLYIIESGEATLAMTSSTGETAMRLNTGAGSLLGLPAVIGDQPYSLTATARMGFVVSFVVRDDFEELLRVDPSMNLYFLRVLAKEVRAARHAFSDCGNQSSAAPHRPAR